MVEKLYVGQPMTKRLVINFEGEIMLRQTPRGELQTDVVSSAGVSRSLGPASRFPENSSTCCYALFRFTKPLELSAHPSLSSNHGRCHGSNSASIDSGPSATESSGKKWLTIAIIAIGLLVTVCNARLEAVPNSRKSDAVGHGFPSLSKQQMEMVTIIKNMVSRFPPKEKLELRRALERQAQAPVPQITGFSKGLIPDEIQNLLNAINGLPLPDPIKILLITLLLPIILPGIPVFLVLRLLGL
ncbi:unnamed protein product [Cyprideis torosa]|uniref:Uncharacterized protein n=1 Tax=Cyprideis torosa TaxID=163714 RepID=A0A7R8ZIL8_9CRUS|nr:unnamed protein product [Cyprideis torosa]CAG0885032.1 unnamed protein product [Cyprideis torosa]